MPAPVYSAGAPGNLINGVTVAKGATIAAFLDLSTVIEGQATCEIATGATAPTAGTTFSAYKVYGNSAAITISGGVTAGATAITVSSATAIHQNQRVALQQAGGSKLGEVVNVTAVSGSTLTITATINSYSTNDLVYLIDQTASFAVTPSGPTGSWAATTDYSAPMFLGTGQWAIGANNTDTAQSVTASLSLDKITSYV